MEFSQIFGFLKILSESSKLVLRNAKLMASITTLHLLLTSIFFLLFSFSYQSASNYMTNSITDSITNSSYGIFFLRIIIFFALVFAVQLTFMFSYIAIGHVSWMATVIATVTSYTGSKLSLQDLFASVKKKWRSPFRLRKNFRVSRNSMYLLLSIFAMTVAIIVVVLYPNPVTITVASAVGFSIFVFYLYASVAPNLSAVILVVEDGCEAAEAVEKAEKLVEGQRLHGFMVNLFFNILGLIVFLSFWMIVGDKWSLSETVYVLFFVDCASVTMIFVGVAYTVYYFRCKEYHGEKIQLFGNFNYTTLLNDIP